MRSSESQPFVARFVTNLFFSFPFIIFPFFPFISLRLRRSMGTLSEKNSTSGAAFFSLPFLSPSLHYLSPLSLPAFFFPISSTSSGTPPFHLRARPSSSSPSCLFCLHLSTTSSSSGERGLAFFFFLPAFFFSPFSCLSPVPPLSGTGAFLSAPLHKYSNNFFFSFFLFYSLPSPSFLPKLPYPKSSNLPLPSSHHLSLRPPRPLTRSRPDGDSFASSSPPSTSSRVAFFRSARLCLCRPPSATKVIHPDS